MSRSALLLDHLPVLVFATLMLALSGCANLVETRTITAFTQALQDRDSQRLKDSVSPRFERKALRLAESVDDFAVLRLPQGEIHIINVEELSDTEKRVTVEIGESKERVKYRLVKDLQSKHWVVDDVQIRQKKGTVVATRSVSELMDLIATVREFLVAWDSGVRSDIVALATPEFGQLLGGLPPEFVAKLADQTIGDRAQDMKIRPEAQIDEESAVVRLPRKSGQMLISFRKIEGNWLISDVAVESRGDKEHIPSVRQMATALRSAVRFLEAYNSGDKDQLRTVCKPKFFNGSLESTDLSLVRLPTPAEAVKDYQLKLDSGVADLIVTGKDDIIKISLTRIEGEDSQAPSEYLVDEVSLYDLHENQEKRLSSLFLSHGLVEAFAEALALRNLDVLLLLATPDFKQRVWNRVDEATALQLPTPEIENCVPTVLTTVFLGSVTEVTVRQGSHALVYVLQDRSGKLYIDDVVLPSSGRPASLKQTLEMLVSIHDFARALAAEDLAALRKSSSRDFNRGVWQVAQQVPHLGANPLEHLRCPLITLDVDEEKSVAGLGDDQFGARVLLVKEGDRFVIDDVLLIAGLEARHRVALKDAMRGELSRFRGPVTSNRATAEKSPPLLDSGP